MYIVILNYNSKAIDCFDLSNKPAEMDTEEYIESELEYSLTDCHWMETEEKVQITFR
jgi:hypothetical protein